jgi:hypothetical protein
MRPCGSSSSFKRDPAYERVITTRESAPFPRVRLAPAIFGISVLEGRISGAGL